MTNGKAALIYLGAPIAGVVGAAPGALIGTVGATALAPKNGTAVVAAVVGGATLAVVGGIGAIIWYTKAVA